MTAWPTLDGQTPLTANDVAGLRLPVLTRGDLDALEALSIAGASGWLRRPGPRNAASCLDDSFLDGLHRAMLGDVWTWAGRRRQHDTNIGCEWHQIPKRLAQLRIERDGWMPYAMDPDEVAVRVSHRLVAIDLYPNGNGRHARLVADHLAMALGRAPFTWGRSNLVAVDQVRRRHLAALRAADGGDIAPLVAFARG